MKQFNASTKKAQGYEDRKIHRSDPTWSSTMHTSMRRAVKDEFGVIILTLAVVDANCFQSRILEQRLHDDFFSALLQEGSSEHHTQVQLLERAL